MVAMRGRFPGRQRAASSTNDKGVAWQLMQGSPNKASVMRNTPGLVRETPRPSVANGRRHSCAPVNTAHRTAHRTAALALVLTSFAARSTTVAARQAHSPGRRAHLSLDSSNRC